MASSMHESGFNSLKRVVLLLLVLRVAAAPIALRPMPTNPVRVVMVVRVCAWPVHQARVTSAKLTEGRDDQVVPVSPAPLVPRSVPPTTAADWPLSFLHDDSRRLLSCLRC